MEEANKTVQGYVEMVKPSEENRDKELDQTDINVERRHLDEKKNHIVQVFEVQHQALGHSNIPCVESMEDPASPQEILQENLKQSLWTLPLEMSMGSALKESSFLTCPSSPLVVSSIGICRTPTVTGQMANSVALVAFGSTLSILGNHASEETDNGYNADEAISYVPDESVELQRNTNDTPREDDHIKQMKETTEDTTDVLEAAAKKTKQTAKDEDTTRKIKGKCACCKIFDHTQVERPKNLGLGAGAGETKKKSSQAPKGDHDSEDEVTSVDNDMARSLASERIGFGTQSLLEQWRDSFGDGDYDEDPYDDDMYEGQDLSEELQTICDKLDIRVQGRKKQ
nr:hypothetical protein [Tanacetum cinerariifolium]